MTSTILLTGFGPFPGAPVNPTAPLVRALVRRNRCGKSHIRRIAHVFETSYAAVDRELPELLARARPDVIIMFGLAQRSRHIRIETRARNTLSSALPDASGRRPDAQVIAAQAPPALALPAAAAKLVAAVRAAGLSAARSDDAGSYLCNYLCWRACEAAQQRDGLRLVAFVHVPTVRMARLRPGSRPRLQSPRPPLTLDDLIGAGEATVLAALTAARITH